MESKPKRGRPKKLPGKVKNYEVSATVAKKLTFQAKNEAENWTVENGKKPVKKVKIKPADSM